MSAPRTQARWRWSLASALTVTVIAASGAAASGSSAAPVGPGTGTGPGIVESYRVTLVTGDRLLVDRHPDGTHAVAVDPAARAGGAYVTFRSVEDGESLYVLPSDAARLIPDTLDRELFNVTKLADYGYTDGVPVITSYDGPAPAPARATGLDRPERLESIGAVAATVDPAGRWWADISRPRARATAGVDQVWLDEQVTATLADSVPMVGAPQAWDQGYDGTGVTVAVLDTGIDGDHPDLAGKVVAEHNFTGTDTAGDRRGHGTHVASTVAGIGAASGGAYTGVAPGAEVLNGKVLDDEGNGFLSDIIAGMEWAVAQGADVVNMSLGTRSASDGTDPISQAVNTLTAQHDVLFVVAAGNTGPAGRVGSPGAADAALTVGAVDKNRQLASFSSRGPRVGDYAVKPDLTAPGVAITAARAGGTALGDVVDDYYTTASGTSMATPHVAGAAALLLAAEPQLTGPELKARLMGSAVPAPGSDAYQQGAGMLDIPAALASPVVTSPTTLDLGYHLYPYDDARPETTEVAYHNRSDAAVTVDLSLSVRGEFGQVPQPEMLSMTPATLTIAPGGSATATVTLDTSAGEYALYSGYLTATDSSTGDVVTHTAVGFYKEPERYDLTIIGTSRDGRPAMIDSYVDILDVENMARLLRPGNFFQDGAVRMRVAPGSYSVMGEIHTYDAHNQDIQQTAWVGDPEVRVDGDTTVVLDARDAARITVETPDHPAAAPQAYAGHGYMRTAAQPGPLLGINSLFLPPTREYFASQTEPVTLGEFEFYTRWQMAEPEARLAVTAPVERQLHPVLLNAPAVDGEQVVRLVDVGSGTAADYSDVDVTGAAVLATRGPVPYREQQRLAAEAGAVAVVVVNDVPGYLVGTLGEPGQIPALSLTRAEGEALRDLLATGAVTIRLDGTRWSPYLYDLLLREPGAVPGDLAYTVDNDRLAAVEVSYHNDVAGHEMEVARHFRRFPYASFVFLHPPIVGPRQRTEYLIGGDGTQYYQTVYAERPLQAQLTEPGLRTYQAGERTTQSWFRQVVRPALLPEVATTRRAGDTLELAIHEWVDDAGNYFPHRYGLAPYPGDTVATRVYRDGELIGEAVRPQGSFPMAAGPAGYRVELDVTRQADWWRRSTATRTTWQFRSAPGDGVLPLLSVDFDLDEDPGNADLWNAVPHPRDRQGPPAVGFQVRQQAAELPPIARARLWISYDDGATWQRRPVRNRGGGRFEAVLPIRPAAGGSGYVSVRVAAWDLGGNAIEQEIQRAWRARP